MLKFFYHNGILKNEEGNLELVHNEPAGKLNERMVIRYWFMRNLHAKAYVPLD